MKTNNVKRIVAMVVAIIAMVFGFAVNANAMSSTELSQDFFAEVKSEAPAVKENGSGPAIASESFDASAFTMVDKKLLLINVATNQGSILQLENSSDFDTLATETLAAKKRKTSVQWLVVAQDAEVAEHLCMSLDKVTSASNAAQEGPTFTVAKSGSLTSKPAAKAVLQKAGMNPDDAVAFFVTGTKIGQSRMAKFMNRVSQINDLVSIPSNIKSSWNSIRGKSGW